MLSCHYLEGRTDDQQTSRPHTKKCLWTSWGWVVTRFMFAATNLGTRPDPSGLPGTPQLQGFVGGLLFWGLLAALAGLAISAAWWALGSRSGNFHHASQGKSGLFVSLAAAFVIGGAKALVGFFEAAGSGIG